MNGSRLFIWWKSTVMYAVFASYFDATRLRTDPHAGRSGMFFVRFVQVRPLSFVSWTRPSFVPTQIIPRCNGDSAIPYTTPAYSTPMLSGVSPPELFMRVRSFSVRSGEMTSHDWPPFVVRCTCCDP